MPDGHPYAASIDETPMQGFHIALPGRSVLVDAPSDDLPPDFEDMRVPGRRRPSLPEQLAALGASADTVTDVVITHWHTDHINGLTRLLDGQYRPWFSNARHYLGAGDWRPADFGDLEKHTLGVLMDAGRLTLVEGDLRSIRLPDAGRYRMGLIALNTILLMAGRTDRAAALATLAAHLAPGGLAVVDAWLPEAQDLVRFDGRLHLEWMRRDPESGEWVTKEASARHEPATGAVELTALYSSGAQGEAPRRYVRVDRLHLVTPDDLVALAEASGFEVERVAGDYELGPLRGDSERVVLVLRMAPGG